ncbi:hypothetical protein J8273_4401 [Carpediemonas membranifera]|uniref:Uncharacterized protein n=1 Tax=Carpediemonas membranifera TaxID=201153 RepID=A0A8J6B212_9EUKA|nr:hypothetical protein J8273_4401 [Carpediemonas membranifera]|eukprot:KAG9394038.1 hypothetical protein J8273_4401 [Carpediemonas membranifera]
MKLSVSLALIALVAAFSLTEIGTTGMSDRFGFFGPIVAADAKTAVIPIGRWEDKGNNKTVINVYGVGADSKWSLINSFVNDEHDIAIPAFLSEDFLIAASVALGTQDPDAHVDIYSRHGNDFAPFQDIDLKAGICAFVANADRFIGIHLDNTIYEYVLSNGKFVPGVSSKVSFSYPARSVQILADDMLLVQSNATDAYTVVKKNGSWVTSEVHSVPPDFNLEDGVTNKCGFGLGAFTNTNDGAPTMVIFRRSADVLTHFKYVIKAQDVPGISVDDISDIDYRVMDANTILVQITISTFDPSKAVSTGRLTLTRDEATWSAEKFESSEVPVKNSFLTNGGVTENGNIVAFAFSQTEAYAFLGK